jgi:hypothetical protein
MIPEIEGGGGGYPQIRADQTNQKGVTKNMGMDNVPRCQHIKMNGTQCGSPALRWRRLCFFHDRIKRERAKIAADMTAQRRFDLPLLEDANSVQVSLMKVIQMLGSGRLDHRTAGLMLYALQTASVNLRHANFEARFATDVVIDRDDVHRTSLGGPQWFEEDFEDEPEEQEAENETENEIEEADDEAAIAAAPVQSAAVKKEPAAVNHFTTEDARRSVQGTTRNWLPETSGGNGAVKPG